MNRSTQNKAKEGEHFIRDYLGVVLGDASNAPSVEAPDARFEDRRRWATTTLAAFGIAAIAGALFSIAGAYWNAWTSDARAAFLIGALAVAHVAGVGVERRGERLLAHFLYWLGASTFIVGVFVAFVSSEADAAQTTAYWADALPPAALLVFATAQTSRSRVLHLLATAAIVAAFAFDDGSRYIFAFRFADWTFVCCALGEYWAWRRESRCVATVYFGVWLWSLGEILGAPLPRGAHALLLVCALGFFLRWFGASFRSAVGATFGTAVAFAALGLTAFPYFWRLTFETTTRPPVWLDVPTAATFEAILTAVLFVFFSVRLIFDGARQNVVQFAVAIAFFAVWLTAQCVVAALNFATFPSAIAPPTAAALVFSVLLLKGRFASPAPEPTRSNDAEDPESLEPPAVASDALDDDQDFDDLFDAEARAGSETPRLSSISDSLDEFWATVAQKLRFPLYVLSVVAQAVALVDFSRSDLRFF